MLQVISSRLENRSGEAKCYTNLGVAYESLGDFTKAIEYQEKALQIKKEIGDKPGEAKCYTNLGNAYFGLGDFTKAINFHESSLEVDKSIGDRLGETACYSGLGIAYFGLGDFRRAIKYYEKTLEKNRPIGDRLIDSNCYANLGNAYHNLGNFRRAIKFHLRSLEIKSEITDRSGEASCYGNLGVAYESLGDFKRAIEYHEKSLQICKEIGNRSGEAKCYTNLGNAYFNLGDFRKAFEYYEMSLKIARELDEIEQERVIYLNLAELCRKSNPELAYDYCKRSIQLSEIISKKLVQEDYSREFRAQASIAYRLMVPLRLKLGKENEAFEYVEGSKSRAFLELLAATKIKPTAELTNEISALLKDEEALMDRWREIQTRHLKHTNTTVEPEETERILQKLNTIYDEISKVDPEYVSARRAKPLTLNNTLETLSQLKKPTILIEYFVTGEETFIFVVSSKNKELNVTTVPLSEKKLRRYIKKFEKEVRNYDSKVGDIGESWLELSDYLIKPIESLITGDDLVCFVPYGLLHSIPLHALKLQDKRLIETHPVIYSPSAAMIRFNQNKGSGKLESCISFGVAIKDQIRLEQIVEDTANGVAKFFNTKAYNLKNATKETALKEIENKDVVHFSCHGYLNQKDPLSSGVVLYNEEILSAKEIFDLKLNAEIVTLGACQTGVSERSLGDELVGLTRAFLYAGAPSLIVSLWSVNATSTKELILEFYPLAKSGVDKATALQQAQKKTMKNYPHPYYWAPFILVGKD